MRIKEQDMIVSATHQNDENIVSKSNSSTALHSCGRQSRSKFACFIGVLTGFTSNSSKEVNSNRDDKRPQA